MQGLYFAIIINSNNLMHKYFKKILFLIIICSLATIPNLKAETADIKEILGIIQKDLRTLERAVYSESFSTSSKSSSTQEMTQKNAEDVLTKHLLKLSDIEKQFQELTNKYEEINFKMDKLSSRLSKVQADNQLRFQNLENNTKINNVENNSLASVPKSENNQKEQDLCQNTGLRIMQRYPGTKLFHPYLL